jgi:uncharacterized protein YwqG
MVSLLQIQNKEGTNMKYGSAIYSSEPSVVMHLNGKKYKVIVEAEFSEEIPAMPVSAKVDISLTEEPVTISDESGWCRYKFGGYPHFIQGEVLPTDDNDQPYAYICTIESNWGDCGNGNVFALIKDDKVVDVYVEANCA